MDSSVVLKMYGILILLDLCTSHNTPDESNMPLSDPTSTVETPQDVSMGSDIIFTGEESIFSTAYRGSSDSLDYYTVSFTSKPVAFPTAAVVTAILSISSSPHQSSIPTTATATSKSLVTHELIASTPTSNSNSVPTTPPPTPPKSTKECPVNRDKIFNILWPKTFGDRERRLPCPFNFTGEVSRFCDRFGDWKNPNFMECQATTIEGLDIVTTTFFNSGEDDMENAMFFVRQLRDLSRPPSQNHRDPFLSRNNLRTVNSITRGTLRLLQMDTNTNTSVDVADVFKVFSNALDSRNKETWKSLQEFESGSEELLSNAEIFAKITASRIQQLGETVRYSEENIALRAERLRIDMEDYRFPTMEDVVNTSFVGYNRIKISSEYIRAMSAKNANDVPIAFILFPTLHDVLPYVAMDENVTIGSVILSAQVLTTSSSKSTVLDNPIDMNFTVNVNNTGDFSAICVYWNFTTNFNFNSTDTGGWVSDGIITEIIDNTTVRCLSSHLTSFAVLVDVTGSFIETQNETSDEVVAEKALSIVSYFGCAVSVVCLMATIVFLLSFKEKLFNAKIHYFIHLNLAISLLLGYIVFIGGINYASTYKVSCTIVAALLHYFFLAAFCWMLCEAILMYLLVVLVFSKFATKYYLFILIGWGVPLVVVSITLGSFFNHYIDESGICWLNYSNHIIWSFVAPMCFIVVINTFVLGAVSVQLYRTKKKMHKLDKSGFSTKDNHTERSKTVTDLLKGVIVLLPLLGITWMVGLFAFNDATLFFAWLFTILNSLQGLFIFIFHVACTEEFSSMVGRWTKTKRSSSPNDFTASNGTRKSMDSLDKV